MFQMEHECSCKEPLNKLARWTPTLIILKCIISFNPMPYFLSTKRTTNYITPVVKKNPTPAS
jgi:hypothetical protein